MASQNTNPFYGSSGGGIPANGGQQRLALDNLMRRELKSSDPNDPKQIAKCVACAIQGRSSRQCHFTGGQRLTVLVVSPLCQLCLSSVTSSDSELQQAKDDVEKDLQELTTNALLKDVIPEITGMGAIVTSCNHRGHPAARFAWIHVNETRPSLSAASWATMHVLPVWSVR